MANKKKGSPKMPKNTVAKKTGPNFASGGMNKQMNKMMGKNNKKGC